MAAKKRNRRGTKKAGEAENLYLHWKRHAKNVAHGFRAYPVRVGEGPFKRLIASDIFGVTDVLTMDCTSGVEFAQIKTSAKDFTKARRLIEAVSWAPGVRVVLGCHEPMPDPADERKAWHYWRRDELLRDYAWEACAPCRGSGRNRPEGQEAFFDCPDCGGRGQVATRIIRVAWVKHEAARFQPKDVTNEHLIESREKKATAKAKAEAKEARRAARAAGNPNHHTETT